MDFGDALAAGSSGRSEGSSTSTRELHSQHIYELQLEVNALRAEIQTLRSALQALEESLARAWVNQTGHHQRLSWLEGIIQTLRAACRVFLEPGAMNTFSASILQQLAGVTREQLDGALPPAQATLGPPELPFAPVPDLGDAFPANPSPASASADNWGFVGFTGDFEGSTNDFTAPVSEVEVQQTHEFPPSPPVGFNPNHFEAHLAPLCEPDEQAPSLSLLGSGDENTAWYEDVRAMSESHFSLVPSASKRDFGEEVRPGRIARAVGDERSRTAVASPALPWERGVFRAIFGDEGLTSPFDNLVLKMPGPLVPAHVPPAEPKIPEPPIPSADIASRAFKSFKDVHPSDERDMVMDRAVCKLQHIICRTDVDRLSPELAKAASSKDATDEVFGIVSACVGLRSPHTVVKRANAILAYLRWCDKEGYEKPFCEDSVWSFISYLKKEKAAPTRAASLISALRFANFVLGLSVSEVLASRRILGLSAQLGVKKKATNRARPLKVSEVRFMHGVLEDESAPIWDRAICAYLLLALYARARHSDLVLVEEVIADFDRQCSGYLEIRLRFHKTAQTIAKKNDLLPVIVSSKGIVKGDWLGLATDVFERVGLTLDGTVGSFHPDAARALYFTDPPAPTVVPQAPEFRAAVKAKVEIINDSASERAESEGQHSSSGSESSDSESQDDSDSSSESIAPIKAPRLEIEQWDAADCAANSRTRTLHLLKFVSGGGNLIATCGRTSEVMVQAAQAHMSFRRYLGVLTCTVGCPKLLLLAMSSLIDSGAHFKRRADEVGLSSAGWTILQALGITSVGKAAYTITSPGEPVTEPIFRDWVADNAAGMTLGDQSCLKRLVFESQTLVVAELRDQVSGSQSSAPRRVPEAERDRRLNDLRAALPGITLEGVNMPSNALLDSCCQQERDNLLKYIPPEKATSRTHELTNPRPTHQALQVEASKIVLKSDADAVEYQPVNVLQTMEALRRRGLAMVFAQMISYDAYDRYVNRLFNHLSRDPPPGLNRVNVTQLVNADKQVFALLAEWGVKPRRDTAGEYPLDREMHRALESYEVSIALMHQAPQGKFPFKNNRKRHPSRPSTPDPPTKLPKGKGRGKGAKGGPAMPKELVDLKANATTPEGVSSRTRSASVLPPALERLRSPLKQFCIVIHSCLSLPRLLSQLETWLMHAIPYPLLVNSTPKPCFPAAGGLWIEGAGEEVCPDPGHPDAKGHVLQLHEPIQFDAHRLHATCPWTGNRTVLAAFVINDFHKLDAQHRQLLQHTAFRLPSLSTGELLPLRPSIASRFPVVLEIFAGTARVTAALRRCGFVGAQGVDHVVVDHAACPVLLADLTTQEGQRLTMMWLSSPHVVGVFIAPPCGTSSRAREIALPGPSPAPLRSLTFPDGLPHLSGLNLVRVNRANQLYHFTTTICAEAHHRNLIIAVENPRSSLYWSTSFWAAAASLCPMHTDFQHCAFGGRRPKWTRLCHNHQAFHALHRVCPGGACAAQHLPWGRSEDGSFATASETAYPPQLATAIAQCFARAVTFLPEAEPSVAAMRATSGLQPKASAVPPLVPEHKAVLVMTGPSDATSLPTLRARLPEPWSDSRFAPAGPVPAHSQLLRADKKGSDRLELAWGICWSPEEFIHKAVQAGHPKKFDSLLPSALSHSIDVNAKTTPADRAGLRAEWFAKWTKRAAELSGDEKKLKSSLPEYARKIVLPKRILLWREILEDLKYPDIGVLDEMLEGVHLTSEQLRSKASESRQRIIDAIKSQGHLDEALEQKVDEEVELGWLSEPIDPADLPEDATISRRFAIEQSGKIRLIDDLSDSGVNGSVQTTESPKPQSLDVVAAMALACLRQLPGTPMLGKTFDLKSAYRQMFVSPDDLILSSQRACAIVASSSPKNLWATHLSVFHIPSNATPAISKNP
ncbi:unnamed protein product [Symbiodinium sp. CCMP2592]|nr:unnamed protein product [Symbiodinium sp. CCMP2592]